MARFLIDEDMHRSLAQVLHKLGHVVLDVRDEGLRGRPDQEVFRFAQDRQAVLITSDLGFGDINRYPLGSHHGIVLTRFPNELPTDRINAELAKNLRDLTDQDFSGNLIVVSLGKVRIRRARP